MPDLHEISSKRRPPNVLTKVSYDDSYNFGERKKVILRVLQVMEGKKLKIVRPSYNGRDLYRFQCVFCG